MAFPADPQKLPFALSWLVTLLDHHAVPYQIVGGLAAHAYGATRPVVDVDLYMPFDRAQSFLTDIQPFIVRPPLPHRSDSWDLVYLALEYAEVYIEIGDSSTHPRFYNRIDGRWEDQTLVYDAAVTATLFGVAVKVMPREELVRYKRMLDREVDHLDLAEMGDLHYPDIH
jgi:hypothetical protein